MEPTLWLNSALTSDDSACACRYMRSTQMHSIMYVNRTCSLVLLGSRSVALARSLASAGDANLYQGFRVCDLAFRV